MSEMIERVAIALHGMHGSAAPYADYADDWRDMARAAIEAMREPTEAMISEGFTCIPVYDSSNDDAKCVWQAMVEEALKS